MTDVQTNFKSTVVCACGCGKEGQPRRKAWRDGMHVRDCTCRRCVNGERTKAEKKRVTRFGARSGLYRAPNSGRMLGFDLGGVVAVEETSEQTITKHLKLWWATVEVQRKLQRIRRQPRLPWAFVGSWEGKPQLVVMSPDGFSALCLAACGSDMELALQLIDQAVEATLPPCETTGDE